MVLDCIILICQDDGIGRHEGVKILWAWKTRTGSSPVLGTNIIVLHEFTANYVNSYNNSRQASWVIIYNNTKT